MHRVGASVPQPDPAITKLEDETVRHTAGPAKMGAPQVSTSSSPIMPKEVFPTRPAFGTRGTEVVLWANYFQVKAKPITIYKYNMNVVQVPNEDEKGDTGKAKGRTKPGPKEIKGRKLFFAIQAALLELKKRDPKAILATEYKSQLISLRPLELDGAPLRCSTPSDRNPELLDVFDVEFNGPAEASLDEMIKYLHSTGPTPDDNVFPRFSEAVDALNVIFGHGPRTRISDISPVGSSRFYLIKDGGFKEDLLRDGHAIQALRGYFQSTRLGTGRILLNTNVTHGVFKLSGKMTEIFDKLEIRAVPKQDHANTRKLRLVAKFLPKTRVWVDFKISSGKALRKLKAMNGIARASEISHSKAGDKPPRFQPGWEFGGPENIQFFLQDSTKKDGGAYISVADYYRKSEYFYEPMHRFSY